jgi:S1-C subfamily serine protease
VEIAAAPYHNSGPTPAANGHPEDAMQLVRLVIAGAVALAAALPAAAQSPAMTEKEAEQRIADLVGAVVRVKARALEDARSNATLGRMREGSGAVIDGEGHVLTIGYLVIEADSIEVTTSAGRTVPAILAGYDHASGFGLLKAQAPLNVKPLALGDSSALAVKESVMIVPALGRQTASMAAVVSKRPFAGSWEYLLDTAIFTAPYNEVWSGAALVNRNLELVGVGSLRVADSLGEGVLSPGNMFVPIDLLKPILADLKSQGRASGPPRPWLGMSTEEVQGRLLVTRVSPDSPADKAGVQQGDVVVGIGGQPVKTQAELYTKLWQLGPAGVEVPLKLLAGKDVRDVRVRSIDRVEYFKAKRAL